MKFLVIFHLCSVWAIALLFLVNSAFSTIAPYLRNFDKLKGTLRPLGSIWPRPYRHLQQTEYFSIDTLNFSIDLMDSELKTVANCTILNFATTHYANLIRNLKTKPIENENSKDSRSRIIIQLKKCTPDYPEDYGTDYEKYSIKTGSFITEIFETETDVGSSVIGIIRANSPQGAMRALESFFQMIWREKISARSVPSSGSDSNSDTDDDQLQVKFSINSTFIQDLPRFPHRGLLLDTARHFLPEAVIIKILTGMMYNKLNVFHWHITDDQSFPFQSRTFPELSQKGAYHKKAVYTPEVVQRIIEAARVRGIRTIFEFDTPGHAGGFGKSHQKLLTPCYGDGVTPGSADPSRFAAFENIDPSNEKVYDFMRKLFTEIIQNVTRDKYIHLGMDEVIKTCWESSPVIKEFMRENNYTRIDKVQGHYAHRHVAMVKGLGAKIITWQDPIDDGIKLDNDVVIQVWKEYKTTKHFQNVYKDILNKGHKVILSTGWYLNRPENGQAWMRYYKNDPYLHGEVALEQRGQVLGGEAAVWGEYIDSTNIIQKVFPSVGAVGYVLWDSNIDNTKIGREWMANARFRLDTFRCSLLQRGIPAAPVYSGRCDCENDIEF